MKETTPAMFQTSSTPIETRVNSFSVVSAPPLPTSSLSSLLLLLLASLFSADAANAAALPNFFGESQRRLATVSASA